MFSSFIKTNIKTKLNSHKKYFVSFFSTKFTKQHEYIHFNNDNTAMVGITDFAQNQLGDVVYVDLPKVGDKFNKGDTFGSVESVKAASDVYMPVTGSITEVNENIIKSPNLVNESPMKDGWFIKIKDINLVESNDLLTEESYKNLCDNETKK